LFALAAGLVVDIGSALSHGSTVAREYGLPAVVNVRRGTRSIRTGDLVTVNGTAGTVTVASDE
jgi:pyruvate,water dikinase